MSTVETSRIIDKQEEFTKEIGIAPEKWSPINVAPVKLRELKEELALLSEVEKKQKTQEFIDKYRVQEAPTNSVVPAVAAVAAGGAVAAEVAQAGGMKATVVSLWNRASAAVEKSGGFVKEMWNEFRSWLTDSIPTEKPKLWDDPVGWLKFTFLGFLKPNSSAASETQNSAQVNSEIVPAGGSEAKNEQEKQFFDEAKESLDKGIVEQTSIFLMKRAGEREYDSFFSAVKKAAWDATVGKDDAEKKKEIQKTAAAILGYNTIASVKIGNIMKNKNAENIDTLLGVRLSDSPERRGTEKLAIRYMATALAKNESFIDTALKGTEYEGKWKEMETGKFLRHFYEYTALGTLEKLTGTISSIDFKQPVDVMQNQISKLLISKTNEGKFEGIIVDHLEPLRSEGVDNEVIQRIFLLSEGDMELEAYRSTLKNLTYKHEPAQKFMEKLTERNGFSRSIPGMMTQVGLGSEYTNLLQNGEKIQMKELLSIYAITRGETSMDKLTVGQQSQLLPILYMIAASKNPSSFAAETLSATFRESKNPYVRRVSEFVGESISDAAYTSTLVSAGVARTTVETFLKLRETNPQVFYGTILAIVIAGLFVGRYRKALILAGATGTVASVLVGLAVAQGGSK